MIGESGRIRHHNPWYWIVTVFVGWTMLLVFLRSKGVRGMLVAHCLVPGFFLLFACPYCLSELSNWLSGSPPTLDAESVRVFLLTLARVCFVSSMVSFPASVLQMIVRALRQR